MHSKHEVDRQRGRRRVGNKGSMLPRTEPPRTKPEGGANTAFVRTCESDTSAPHSTPPRFRALHAFFAPCWRRACRKRGLQEATTDKVQQNGGSAALADDMRNSDEHVREKAIATFNRSDRPMGVARQYAAILAQPRWHDRLGSLDLPLRRLRDVNGRRLAGV